MYLPRVTGILSKLERLLVSLRALVEQQRARNIDLRLGANGEAILAPMLLALNNFEESNLDLHESLTEKDAEAFLHELWALGGDMPKCEFDKSLLRDPESFNELLEAISLEALRFTQEMEDEANEAAFMRELRAAN